MADEEPTYVTRHSDVDAAAFDRVAREHMNAAVSGPGHHPYREYSPLAWRHYVRRLALLDRLAGIEFASALDVGCAEGFFMATLAEARGAEVWGVDLSDDAVRIAAGRYGRPVAAAQATALPFADGAFDLVYSTEVIEHVLDPAAMLAEMRRVARRYVLVTTPVSQSADEHTPDYAIEHQGHVNNFDEPSVRRLFGPQADVRTFRCNATFALLTAVGRHLPAPARDWFYDLDRRVARRVGSPHGRFPPLRNRDWLIITPAAGDSPGPREWRCPHCHGELSPEGNSLRCGRDGISFRYVADGVPDFVLSAPAQAVSDG
jgi:SAM-dependent methyltransferase